MIRKKLTLFIKRNNKTQKEKQKKQQSAVRQFQAWFHQDPRNEIHDITKMQPGELDNYLGSFHLSIRGVDGLDYKPDTLTIYKRSFDRFLREQKNPFS